MIHSKETGLSIDSFFHEIDSDRIFCTLIQPTHSVEECIIYFSPLFEERVWTFPIAFNFARTFAASNKMAMLMFDYYGYGESNGLAEDFTLARCRKDVGTLMTKLQADGFSRFVWWGVRTGCAVAMTAMQNEFSPSAAIMWEPIFKLKDYIYDRLRGTMTAQITMYKKMLAKRDVILEELMQRGGCERQGYILNQIDGYRFGREFYQEVLKFDQSPELEKLEIPSLVIQRKMPGKGSDEEKNVHRGQDQSDYRRYKAVPEKEFWTLGRDYSQRADAFYQETIRFLLEVFKHLGATAPMRSAG